MLKNKVLTSILISLIIITILTSFFAFQSMAETISYKVDKNTNAFMSDVEKMITNKDSITQSSNPYDYIDNENYRNIIALGEEAIPVIKEKLASSANNGLEEYLLAIAAEEISKVKIRTHSYEWSTAKEWEKSVDDYIKAVPSKVDSIINSGDSEKIKNTKLTKLGMYAVPYIIKYVENGKTSMKISIEELTDSKNITNTQLAQTKNKYTNIIKKMSTN